MIDSIQIRNFRGIREGEIDGFRRINLFIGPNNSGKSTLMEALYLGCTAGKRAWCQWGDGIEGRGSLKRREEVSVSDRDLLGDHPLFRVLKRHRYPLSEAGQVRYEGGLLTLSLSWLSDQDAPIKEFQLEVPDLPSLSSEEGTALDGRFLVALFALESGSRAGRSELAHKILSSLRKDPGKAGKRTSRARHASAPAEQRSIYLWHPDLIYQRVGTAVWTLGGRCGPPEHVLLFDVSSVHYHFYLSFVRRMVSRIPGWMHKITDSFGRVLGIEESAQRFFVQFLPDRENQKLLQGWVTFADWISLPIDAFGDGARAAFKVLVPLLALAELSNDTSPGVFLWEEAELFQNPHMLTSLLGEIARLVADNRHIQLFMTTHSLDLVAQLAMLVRQGRLPEDSLRVFRTSLEEGVLRSSWFHEANLLAWLDHGLDPRLWSDLGVPFRFTLKGAEEEAE